MKFPVHYGNNLIKELLSGHPHIITTAPLVGKLRELSQRKTNQFHVPGSMDETALQSWEAGLPGMERVLGIGAGVVMDAAKFVAWKRGLPLCLAPSAVSVDAAVTETIGVRRNGRVTYIGEIYPEAVYVDYDMIRSAPANINRAGAGDILSIHTALYDWKLASEKTGERYDPFIARQSRDLLSELSRSALEIQNVTNSGIKKLMELYSAEVALCRQIGSSRPEEGAEHFWAYNVEYRTGKHLVHGELVTLGVLLISVLQNNDPTGIRALVEKIAIRWRPDEIGLTKEQVADSLRTAHQYVKTNNHVYSILDEYDLNEKQVTELLKAVGI